MQIDYRREELERLELDAGFTAGLPEGVVRAYRGRIQALRAAPKEDALRPLRSFELVAEGADGGHSLRVNEEWRLLVSFESAVQDRVTVVHDLVQRTPPETRS